MQRSTTHKSCLAILVFLYKIENLFVGSGSESCDTDVPVERFASQRIPGLSGFSSSLQYQRRGVEIMLNARTLCLSISVLSVITLVGCGGVDVEDNLVTLKPGYFNEAAATKSDMACPYEKRHPELANAKSQIDGDTATQAGQQPLSGFLLSESLVRKIVASSFDAICHDKELTADITQSDMEEYVSMLVKNYGAEREHGIAESRVDNIVRQYLITYYSDTKNGFVDREGTAYKRPEIKTSIGNDIITAVILVSLEGILDGILKVPVYVDSNGKFQTANGVEPTVHKLKFTGQEPIVGQGQEGIDELELKAIRYLSGLAADQSKTLSGLVVRAFGDLEVAFVVGGHFSFGDNDTFAKVLDTFFEVLAKRIVEAKAYYGFSNLNESVATLEKNKGQSDAAELLLVVNGME